MNNDELLAYVRAEESQAKIASTHDKSGEKLWLRRARAFKEIGELIKASKGHIALTKKIEVTEEWIEEKGCEASRFYSVSCKTVADSRDFIRKLVEDVSNG